MNKKTYFDLILFWILFILSWQLLSVVNILNSSFIASPSQILLTFGELKFYQFLITDLPATISRIFLGMAIGYFISLVLALPSIFFQTYNNFIQSLFGFLKYTPAPVVIPLAILFFGLGEGTKIWSVTISFIILYFPFLLNQINQTKNSYQQTTNNWPIGPVQKIVYIFYPVTRLGAYNIIPSLVIWCFGVAIFAEIILGGDYGLGLRLRNFQQIYQTDYLYGYILIILLMALFLEKILLVAFSRLLFDRLKISANVLLLIAIIFSISWFNISSSKDINQPSYPQGKSITTYQSNLNLPIFWIAKNNPELKLNIQKTNSGLQSLDALLANKSQAAGFVDFPNFLTARNKNPNLKAIGYVLETPEKPSLFILTKNKNATIEDFSFLDNQTIAYFPDNPLIQQGLALNLAQGQKSPKNIEYTTSSDPQSLNQAFVTGKIGAILTIEPFASDLEKSENIQRLNQTSLVRLFGIKQIPLAAFVVDQTKFSHTEIETMKKSFAEFILEIEKSEDLQTIKNLSSQQNLNPDAKTSFYIRAQDLQNFNLSRFLNILKVLNLPGLENPETIKADDIAI